MELPVTVISSEIKRGCILHSNDFDKIDHGKFFAIIGEDGDNVVGAFFINSKINSFIFSKPKMLNLQYLLSCRKYTFLNYDSYLCCSKMITMNKSSLHFTLLNLVCFISNRCLTAVYVILAL